MQMPCRVKTLIFVKKTTVGCRCGSGLWRNRQVASVKPGSGGDVKPASGCAWRVGRDGCSPLDQVNRSVTLRSRDIQRFFGNRHRYFAGNDLLALGGETGNREFTHIPEIGRTSKTIRRSPSICGKSTAGGITIGTKGGGLIIGTQPGYGMFDPRCKVGTFGSVPRLPLSGGLPIVRSTQFPIEVA